MTRVCTLLLLAMLAAVPALAGDEKAAAAAQDPMAMMMPGEHHAHLKKLAGNWDYTMKIWAEPGAEPMESTGKRSAEMILGDRYLQEKYTGTFMGMPFEGHGTTGYDNAQKEYVGTWLDNMGTGIMMSTGSCDGKGTWTMTGDMADPATGKMVPTRSVTKLVDDNTYIVEMYLKGPDGKEMKMMEMAHKRAM
jgi:hypothetical protein